MFDDQVQKWRMFLVDDNDDDDDNDQQEKRGEFFSFFYGFVDAWIMYFTAVVSGRSTNSFNLFNPWAQW